MKFVLVAMMALVGMSEGMRLTAPDWTGYDPDHEDRADVTAKEADFVTVYKNKVAAEAPKVWKYDFGDRKCIHYSGC